MLIPPTLPEIERRIKRLETQDRFRTVICLTLLAMLAVSAASPSKPSHIDVTSLNVVDHKNNVRARLALFHDGPRLELVDLEGRTRSRLSLGEEGWGSLRFLDESGRNRAIVATKSDYSTFYALDPTGRGGISALSTGHSSSLTLYDNQKIPQVRGRLQVRQKQGTDHRPSSLVLWNEDHEPRVELSSEVDE